MSTVRRPTSVIYLSVCVVTARALASRPQLLDTIFGDGTFAPTHAGFEDPIRDAYDPATLASCWSEHGDTASLIYRGSVRGFGTLATRRGRGVSENYLSIKLEYADCWKAGLVEAVPALLGRMVSATDAAIGSAGVCVDFRGGGWYRDDAIERVEWDGCSIGHEAVGGGSTSCIGPFSWVSVFGREWTEYIGADRLRALPHAETTEIGDHLWMRLGQWPHELYRPENLARRDAMMESLDLGDAVCGQGRLGPNGWEHSGPEFDRSELRL